MIFGKKIFVQDEILGTLSTRIKSKHPDKIYIWTSEHRLTNNKRETVFLFEGNTSGPTKSHLEIAYRIVKEIESIKDQADIELRKDITKYEKLKNWKSDFYFSALTPFDISRNEFEVNFEPIDDNDTRYVGLIWANGILREIEGK